jgi:DNA-binding HxlR family transcriptional regulator
VIPEESDFAEVIAQSKAACAVLRDEDGGLKRDVLGHAGNRWSLEIVYALGVSGTLRHAEIARRLEGVTQRMLTRSLRQLERDGLISRTVHQESPPRVEYALTELGRGLLRRMIPLWMWVIDNAASFREARVRFDGLVNLDHN